MRCKVNPVRRAIPMLAAALAAGAIDYTPLQNGGFELDANRDRIPDGWDGLTFRSPGSVAVVRDTVAEGAVAVSMRDSKATEPGDWQFGSTRWVQTKRFRARPGETFTAAARIRADLSEGAATLTVAWFGKGSWLQEDSAEPVTGKADWLERRFTPVAPPGAEEGAVYLMLNGGTGTAWFDDVRLVRGPVLPGNFRPIDLGPNADPEPTPATADSAPLQAVRGVPFAVRPVGARPMDGGEAVRIPVGQACDVVYFLHGLAKPAASGTRVGTYQMVLADGTVHAVPLHVGDAIPDPRTGEDTATAAAVPLAPGVPMAGAGVFAWVAPQPQTRIREIRMETAPGVSPLALAAVTLGDGPAVFPEPPLPLHATDKDGWYPWSFDTVSPDAGELDLSRLLDAPAGKHGFVEISESGNLRFADGTPVRFFGTNLGGRLCAPPKADAERLALRFARAGVNLIRLHNIDSRWSGLIAYDGPDTRSFDPEWLDRYDYLVAQLEKAGIYVYFDLLDYRTFKDGDAVRDAEAMGSRWSDSIKGASIVDPRMIELQQEYATKLLTHRNPYTGLRYVDDPGVAVVEITNENSLFYLHNEGLMLESYREDIRQRWNAWLAARYPDREALAAAWTDGRARCGLLPDEDPAAGTVAFAGRYLYADTGLEPFDPLRSAARRKAMTRFLYETQVAYYDTMTAHLRAIGVKCPITGTNQDFSDASNRANAACDLMTRNNYWCHPNLNAKPFPRYSNAAILASDIVREANPVANVASSTVAGKPMISPEFNSPWPNEWRAEMLPLMVAYGRLQEWDGLLYFAYRPGGETLEYFGNQFDPVRWGQVPAAALMFLRGDIAAAKVDVRIGCSATDVEAARPQRTRDRYSPYRVLPYVSKVRTVYFDRICPPGGDVVVASGHSASGDYSGAPRAIVFADSADTGTNEDRGASARLTVPGLRTAPGEGPADTLVEAAGLPANTDILRHEGRPVGMLNDRFLVFPSASKLADPADGGAWLHNLYLQAAARWGIPGAAPIGEAGRVFRSDTGELVLNVERRLFTADAPRACMAVGFMEGNSPVTVGPIRFACGNPFASLSLVSLDDLPLTDSRRLLLTAVGRAENTGQAAVRRVRGGNAGVDADTGLVFLGGNLELAEHGIQPVLVEPVDAVVSVPGAGWEAFALDAAGSRRDRLPVTADDAGSRVAVREARSPWILLVR